MSNPRRQARRLAMQGLYQIQITGYESDGVLKQFLSGEYIGNADIPYFKELLTNVDKNESSLLKLVEPFLDRPVREIDPVERAILLIGSYEMVHRLDIPFRVVIAEGIELAKEFGAAESYRYVNSILDALKSYRDSDN